MIRIYSAEAQNKYAAEELYRFLAEFTNEEVEVATGAADDAGKSITLKVDDSMEAHYYCVKGNGTTLKIAGGNASSVLCGAYEALADAGILFEATGYSVPKAFDLEAFFAVNKEVHPRFRQRGIRQHINFTMDISSYPLREAKEYIRALARMRYNSITFHSYHGQWHEKNPLCETDYAGHFFYGTEHPIPENEPLLASRIDNRKYYCIPEAEAIYEDEAARGVYAKYWLNEVMQTAKDVGMMITLSLEIRTDNDEEEIAMLRNVIKTYPLIDTLELISVECGGFRELPGLTVDNITKFVTDNLGEDILDADRKLPGLPDFVPGQLGSSVECLRRIIHALDMREKWLEGFEKVPAIRAGLYLTCPDTLRVLRPILRNKLPEGMTMSLLPAHGSLAAADNIESTGTTAEDWQNTMFYSWVEFDGNMYVQQMSTDGIEKLVSLPPTDSSFGFCINHWRTVENNMAISYAAEAAITGMSAAAFYEKYAERTNIADKKAFAEACAKLAWLDTYNRDNLFNVGFCALSCWLNWCRRGEAIMPRCFPVDIQERSIATYEELIAAWKGLLPHAGTKEAIAFLRLMINRCQTSVLHIRALLTLDEVAEIFDYENQQPINTEQAKKIEEILNRSRNYAKAYLDLYGSLMPDRGGEGQIISYYHTVPVFINAVAAAFDDSIAVLHQEAYDAPPMPDASVK